MMGADGAADADEVGSEAPKNEAAEDELEVDEDEDEDEDEEEIGRVGPVQGSLPGLSLTPS